MWRRCEGGVHECIENKDFAHLGLNRQEEGKHMRCARSLAWADESMILILYCIHEARRKKPMLVNKFILTRYFIQSTQKRQRYYDRGQGDGRFRRFSMRVTLRFAGGSRGCSNVNSALMKKLTPRDPTRSPMTTTGDRFPGS